MATTPCSVCRHKRPGKNASGYWAWFRADGSRSAYRMRYCADCAPEELGLISRLFAASQDSRDTFACNACGADASGDSDPIYLTLFLPKRDVLEFALQLCGACAAKIRIPIVDQGEVLADRESSMRGPSSSTSTWDAIGATLE